MEDYLRQGKPQTNQALFVSHWTAEVTMLQTNFQQVTNGEFQLLTQLLFRETQRREQTAKMSYRLTCSCHTLRPRNSPRTNTENQWGNPRILACFTAWVIQEFGSTMLICRQRKPTAKESKKERYRRFFAQSHNAALRGECRSNQLTANHFHHQNQPHTKNATRHESLLNALLWARSQAFHKYKIFVFRCDWKTMSTIQTSNSTAL